MRPARGPVPWLCAGLLLLGAGGAASAQTDRPHKRPQPPPASRPLDADNAIGDADLAAPAPPRPTRPPPVALRPAIAPPVLRSAVQSRWSRPAAVARSTAGQCRATCAEGRLSCANGGGDTSGCDPGWSRCLSGCARLDYARGP